MRILCPFCAVSYDIDELLLPEGDIKVRCKNCANIFIINKKIGVVANNNFNDESNNAEEETEKNNLDKGNIENIENKEELEKNEKDYDVKTLNDEHSTEFKNILNSVHKTKENKTKKEDETKEEETENKNIFESEEIKKILKEITDDIERPDMVKSADELGDNKEKEEIKEEINKNDILTKRKNKNGIIKKIFLIFLILVVIIIILYMLDIFGIIHIPYLVGISKYINKNFFKLMSEL
jgi:predicted Zn finger-like uncharacterized protein